MWIYDTDELLREQSKRRQAQSADRAPGENPFPWE
jgi:hypothetical protein